MSKIFFILSVFVVTFLFSDVYVNGYYRKDGTYVEPHYRSSPNDTKSDNWSTYGNVNPYTNEEGTKRYDDYNNYGRSSDSYSGNNVYDDEYDDEYHNNQYNYSKKTLYKNEVKEDEISIYQHIFFIFCLYIVVFGIYSFMGQKLYEWFSSSSYDMSGKTMIFLLIITIIGYLIIINT